MANTNTTNRSNRVSVQAMDGIFTATFYRTHKVLGKMVSTDTDWEANPEDNKTAQREDFRKYAISHCDTMGIEWNPADLRAEGNIRKAKYESDEDLINDAISMVWSDMFNLVTGIDTTLIPSLTMGVITVDNIEPQYKTAKGTDLDTLGVLDGKYSKTGNWAWATLDMTMPITVNGDGEVEDEIYFTFKVDLVSGQLKKPHITKTAFAEDIKESLAEIGIELDTSAKAEEEVDIKGMKKAELIEYAQGKGIEVTDKMTKAEIIEAINK